VTRLLAAVTALALTASHAFAQQPDSSWGVRLPWRHADSLRLALPSAFVGAGRLAWPRRPPAVLAAAWADSVRAALAGRGERRWRAGLLGDTALLAVPRPSELLATLPPPDAGPGRGPLLTQVAELSLQLNALFEMRFERLRNLRCTAADASQVGIGCRAGFTPPRFEPQFQVRTGGVVGQRIHVNVDYDSEREFDASNNVQVFYQGLDDEILRRVQVGNVTLHTPSLRYATGRIPTNNFGVQVEGQLGALEFSGIYAQQRGNVVRDRVFTVGDATVQAVERELRDRDFERGRFFFVVDPATLPNYPAVDILGLLGQPLPDTSRVTQARIYRRRGALNRPSAEQNLVGIEAVALRPDSPQRAGPWTWELLLEGRDYYLDPSGLWLALASRLSDDDYLAVSYVTDAGDTVGTFPTAFVAGRVDTLRLVQEPRRSADVPTFRYEIRSAYRVGAVDDVARATMFLALRVAESEKPAGSAASFLQLLGLALETDANTFDQYNRLFPRARDPGLGAPLRDFFIVLPHLTPFADSARLAPEYRSDSLYRTPTYALETQGPTPLFRLALRYDARGGDDRGVLSLGGFQIREGSERLTARGRQLERNVHYTVNYEVGQVTFLRPDSLFPEPTAVTVQYEENQAFAVAPTTVLGLQTRYDLGDHGSMTVIGLYQRERSLFTRPPLGYEPTSSFVGGVAGAFRFEPRRLTRLLDALPLVQTEAPSFVTLNAEFATSRPSPNQLGVAYVETFESESGTFLPLDEDLWEYGSRPGSTRGLTGTGIDPTGFADSNAVPLTWQNLIAGPGNQIVQFRSPDIDPAIRLQGAAQQAERVLFLGLHPDTVGGLPDPTTFRPRWLLPRDSLPGPRWRSMTLPLSATGVDLTRIEFLEFWVLEDPNRRARAAGASVIFDFGTVFEDAVDFVPDSLFRPAPGDTVYAGRRRAGEGRLDTERDSLTNTFNAAINDLGILGSVADSVRDVRADTVLRRFPLCRSSQGQGLVVDEWGSLFSSCTRRNGRPDGEDLNNDLRLDTLTATAQEDHFRFVFPVGDPRYFVRDGGNAGSLGQWRLYRIPFRLATDTVGLPDLRLIRALRMTVVTPPSAGAESLLTFAIARLKLVGAPWVKRAGTPIAGLAGDRPAQPLHGEVVASVVSTENRDDLGYEPPPGVTDQGTNVGGGLEIGAQQINERSLRLLGTDVRPGERAEAFLRFPEGDRNFLGYRQLRVWARGRGQGWDTRELSLFVKVGHDHNNFYLYRAQAGTTTWQPELVVDFGRWLALRALIETRYLSGLPPDTAAARRCGGDPLAYVACDTLRTYVVHVRNPGVAPPNLIRVQELAVGFVRDSGNALDTAELWIDDLRLTGVVDEAGFAGGVDLRVAAADVADLTVQLSRRDGNFRQLGEEPSYVTTNQLAVSAAVRLEKFGLERLGLAAPFTVRTDRSGSDPYYLNRTDVLAQGLAGLRRPERSVTSYSVQVRRTRRGDAWWQRAVTDNLSFAASWSSAASTTELSRETARVSDMRADYQVSPREITVPYLPGFVRRALGSLPGFLRNAEAVRGLRDGRLRLTPATFGLGSSIARTRGDRTSFRAPIPTPFDTTAPVSASTAVLRSGFRLDLRPFTSMGLGMDYTADRDLKDYGDSTTVAVLTAQSGRRLLGVDVGFERQRRLDTRLSWAPPVASWIRPRLTWTAGFTLNRDPNNRDAERTLGDTAGGFRLPTAFATTRVTDLTAAVDLPRALRGLLGDSSTLYRVLDVVTSLDVGRRVERRSQFNRPGFDPGLGFQLGTGGEDGFRQQGGVLATAATASIQDRLSAGFRLPLGLSLNGAYAQRVGTTWSLRGDVQQEQRTIETDWPNVTARWTITPPGGLLRRVASALTATAGIRRREAVTELPSLQGTGPGVRTAQVSEGTPFSVGITWGARIVTNVSWSDERTAIDRPGARTVNDRSSTAVDATFAFRVPPDLLPLRSPVRATLRAQGSRNLACVQREGLATCTAIADSDRDEYALVLDTDMPPTVTAGLSVGYVLTEDRHVNRKFSQFTLTATVRVAFNAGEVR